MAERLWRALLDLTHGAATGDFESLIKRVTETAGEVLNVERAAIWIEAPENDSLLQVDLYIKSKRSHEVGFSVPRAQIGNYLEALQLEQTLAVTHPRTDPRTADLISVRFDRFGITSVLDGAVTLGGRLVGIIGISHTAEPRDWTTSERNFVASLGDHVALLIESERRRVAESDLKKQQAFLRQIIDLNPHLIFAKDRDGRFTLINQAVAEVYGTTVEALLGKSDADFNSNAAEVAHFLEQDRLVMDTGNERLIPEEQITDASGKTRWLETIKRPIFDTEGRATQVLGVATDITLRKKMEEERLQMAHELRQAQKLESIGVLAGGVAHDFNNLLTPILSSAEQGLGDLPPNHPVRELLHEVLEAGRRAKDLTAQLLAFGRKQMLDLRSLDLNEEVRSATKILSRLIPEHVRISLELTAQLPSVRADPVQIQQVLVNLVVNAKDAMPHGGTIDIATRLVKSPGADRVQLIVRDGGIGIPPELLPRLFEPFFTTKALGRGTGLGLSTVYGIVEQHGGTIAVESSPGSGTTFRINFPSATNAVVPAEVEAARPGPPVRSERILLVEDDPQVLLVVARTLRRQGYTVLTASSAKDAIAQAAQVKETIHLLLSDVIMPGQNGRELYEELRPLRPELQVIFMSGHAQDVLGPRGVLDEGVRLLRKPFTGSELLLKVQEVLESGVPGSRDITPDLLPSS
jgi:two-component system, cell cycle sensor histidine kinase and response regulator CckA